jgi:hypothetical protein
MVVSISAPRALGLVDSAVPHTLACNTLLHRTRRASVGCAGADTRRAIEASARAGSWVLDGTAQAPRSCGFIVVARTTHFTRARIIRLTVLAHLKVDSLNMICSAVSVRKPAMKAFAPLGRVARRTASPVVMKYKVTLETPDGKQEIECDEDTYILDAAEVRPPTFHRSSSRAHRTQIAL